MSESGSSLAQPLLSNDNTVTTIVSSLAKEKDAKRFGFVTGVCFCINYIIGVGILNMPKAFYGAGVALGPAILFALATLIVINILWVTEASARAVALLRFTRATNFVEDKENPTPPDYDVLRMDEEDQVGTKAVEAAHHLKMTLNNHGLRRRLKDEVEQNPSLMNMRFDFEAPNDPLAKAEKTLEVNELLDIFCPFWAKYIYEFSLLLLLFCALWGYAYVFGSSVVRKLAFFSWNTECLLGDSTTADCEWSFRLTVFLFGCAVIFISTREYTEMVTFQLVMTVARFFLIFLVVGVCIVGIFNDPKDNHSHNSEMPYFGNNWEWANYMGIAQMVSTCLFSQLLDFAVPEVIEPLKRKDQISSLFVVSIFGTAFFYTIIGVSSVLYFGDMLAAKNVDMNQLLSNYTGGYATAPWWAIAIQYYVLLFPAFDVLSMYPLVAITLGNSLQAMFVRMHAAYGPKKTLPMRFLRVFCRMLAATPPVLLQSVYVKDLSSIIGYTAFPGCFIACGMPLLLQYYSRKRCEQVGAPITTPYLWSFLSHEWLQLFMAFFCVAVYGILIASTLGYL